MQSLAKETKEVILNLHVKRVMKERAANNGKVSSGFMREIVASLQSQGLPSATRHTVYNHENRLKLLKRRGEEVPDFVRIIDDTTNLNASAASPVSAITEATATNAEAIIANKKGGRPKGSTTAAKITARKNSNIALEEAALLIIKKRKDAKSKGKAIAKGAIASIIQATNDKCSTDIKCPTVISRVNWNNAKGWAGAEATSSPMSEVEPILVALCVKLVRSGQPLDCASFLDLASSLVEGTDIERRIKEHKRMSKQSQDGPLLGKRHYSNFLRRHNTVLGSMKAVKKDTNRALWGTHRNMKIMYECVYKELVEAGIAKVLDTPRWINEKGETVEKEEEAFGCQVEVEVTHPNYFLMADETGCNTNMKTDGHVSGKKHIGEVGKGCQKKAVATDNHFTILPFTNALGEAVLCAIIFVSDVKDKTIKNEWISGIDITVDPTTAATNVAWIEANSGCGKYLPSGPVCTTNGKEVPCYTAASAHGGITSEILTDILRHVDGLELFPREDGIQPFLLLDGHGSRFELEFLQYINSKEHEWCVCIGVPHGTHLWQVGDALSMNGTFKIGVTKAKEAIMSAKQSRRLKEAFVPTDIVPIVNKAWNLSFGTSKNGKKALIERGWNPCNKALLKHDDVLATKLIGDMSADTTRTLDENLHNMATEVSESSVSGNMLNLDTGKVADVLDLLASERDNKEARRRALDRALASQRSIADFDRAKKLTAGKMVAVGSHRLCASVTEHQVAHVKIKEEQEEKRVQRKRKIEEDLMDKVKSLKTKEESNWTTMNYRTMLTYKKQKGDAAHAKTIAGLKRQWSERKDRPSPKHAPVYEQLEGDDDQDDEGNVIIVRKDGEEAGIM